jgi:hypothetical protein
VGKISCTASKLYLCSRVDFSTTKIPDTSDIFYQFEHDPENAAMLFHMNSGGNLFSDIEWLTEEDEHTKEEIDECIYKAMAELDNMILTDEQKDMLMQQYFVAMGRGGYSSLPYEHAKTHLGHTHGKSYVSNANNNSYQHSYDAPIVSCACCGVKDSYRFSNFVQVPLKILIDDFSLTKDQKKKREDFKALPPLRIPVDDNGGTMDVHIHNLQSVYESRDLDCSFNLHPEFIHKDNQGQEACMFCHECHVEWTNNCNNDKKKNKVPNKSVAKGKDFGDFRRLGMTAPNMMEIVAFAKIRHYYSIFKISDNQHGGRTDSTHHRLRGHSICFRHDAAFKAALRFHAAEKNGMSLDQILSRNIIIQLVGSTGKYDKLSKYMENNGFLRLRPHVLYQWLKVLHLTHEQYKNDPELPNWDEFKQIVKDTETNWKENAQHLNEEAAVLQDEILGDDVANVRSRAVNDGEVSKEEECDNSDLCYSTSYIADYAEYNPLSDEIGDQLKRLAQAMNVDLDEDIKEWETTQMEPVLKSYREAIPINEFKEMEEQLTGAFPHIFMFGKAYGTNSLRTEHFRHLLLQYTTTPATEKQLLFYLFDYHIRTTFMSNFSARINNNKTAFEAYAKEVNNEKFLSKVPQAAKDPESDLAKEVYNKISPILQMGSQNQPLGSILDNTCLSRALAMCHRFGPASVFLTVTPDDVSNPTSFRLAFRSFSNFCFPAITTNNFIPSLIQGAEYINEINVPIPTSYAERYKKSCDNPVAVALEFQAMTENLLSILVGCPPKSFHSKQTKSPKQWYFRNHSAEGCPHHTGIFGDITAFFGTIETQQRGALHFHVLLWGGLTPKLLESSVDFPALEAKISAALDSMYQAEAPLSHHILHGINEAHKNIRKLDPNEKPSYDKFPTLNTPRVLLQSPPPTWRENFSGFFNRTILQLGKHVHSWTCKKPPAGANRCRGAMPQANNEKTQSKQLELTGNIKTKDHKVVEVNPKTKRKHLYLNVDGRIIVWELKRPLLQKLPTPPISFDSVNNKTFKPGEPANDLSASTLHDFYTNTLLQLLKEEGTKEYVPGIQQWFHTLQLQTMHLVYNQINEELDTVNGYITQTNDVLAAAAGCSTNAAHLGSSQQSRNAIYYITKYVTKTKVARGNCLLALATSINAISKSPSKAKDTGTDKRTVQQMLTKVHNMLFRHAEISDTQAALTLLGSPSELTSTAFQYVGAKHVLSRVKAELCASQNTRKHTIEGQDQTSSKKQKQSQPPGNHDEHIMDGISSFIDIDSEDEEEMQNTVSANNTEVLPQIIQNQSKHLLLQKSKRHVAFQKQTFLTQIQILKIQQLTMPSLIKKQMKLMYQRKFLFPYRKWIPWDHHF